MTPVHSPAARPRIEGEREAEIYDVVVELLVASGYDRLTFDAVATAAHVSKATLYRRWRAKPELVLDALTHNRCGQPESVDTGTLRGDLLGMACGQGGLCDKSPALIGALVPALHRDPELFAAFHERVLEPGRRVAVAILERAQARGEVAPDADLQLIATSLPAISIHETVLNGSPSTPQRIAQIIDRVVLPACRGTGSAG